MRIEQSVNQRSNLPSTGLYLIGQIRVGDDGKAAVIISAKGTDGHVIVDSLK